MSNTVIRQVKQNVWTFSRPFLRFGLFPIGGRSTAIRLHQGGVWALVSTPLDGETKTKLDELGNITHIIGANSVHWLYLNDFKRAYPSAKLIGVEPLLKKPGCPKLDGVYGHDDPDTKYGFEEEITPCYFSGSINRDVAFFHTDSKTALMADLLINLPAHEQYSKEVQKPYMYRFSLRPEQWIHQKYVWLSGSNKEAMRKDARTVASWDIQTLIPCHGDLIESKAHDAWRVAYRSYL